MNIKKLIASISAAAMALSANGVGAVSFHHGLERLIVTPLSLAYAAHEVGHALKKMNGSNGFVTSIIQPEGWKDKLIHYTPGWDNKSVINKDVGPITASVLAALGMFWAWSDPNWEFLDI